MFRDGTAQDAVEISGSITEDTFVLDFIIRNESDRPLDEISHVYLFASADSAAVPAEMQEAPSWSIGAGYFLSGQSIVQAPPSVMRPVEVDAFSAAKVDSTDGLVQQYRLPLRFSSIPPGAIESGRIVFMLKRKLASATYRLRVHGDDSFHDFYFKLNIDRVDPPAKPK